LGSRKGRWAENFKDQHREYREREEGKERRKHDGTIVGEEEESEPHSPGRHKYWGFFFFFWFFFSELGTEPRALRFLGKRSTTELNPQPLGISYIDN